MKEELFKEEVDFHFRNSGAIDQMVAALFGNAIELTKLVIENRVRNSQKLSDDDEIYSRSLSSISKSLDITR